MRVKDLKMILNQYDDNDLVAVRLSLSTIHSINKSIIKPFKTDEDLFSIKSADVADNTNTLVLNID